MRAHLQFVAMCCADACFASLDFKSCLATLVNTARLKSLRQDIRISTIKDAIVQAFNALAKPVVKKKEFNA